MNSKIILKTFDPEGVEQFHLKHKDILGLRNYYLLKCDFSLHCFISRFDFDKINAFGNCA